MPKIDPDQVTADSLGKPILTIPPSERPRRRNWAVDRPDKFFRAIGQELFLVAKNIRLSRKAEGEADLLALDRDGKAVVVVWRREDEASPLARGLTCAAMVSAWKAQDFLEALPEQSAERSRPRLEDINGEQRLILVCEAYDPELIIAAEWLSKQQAIDILCFRASADGCYQQVFPPPQPALELRERGWASVPFPQVRELVREAAKIAGATRWIPLAAAVTIVFGLSMWVQSPSPRQEDVAVESAPLAEVGPTTPVGVIGRVEDAVTHNPIAGAKVYHAGELVLTDSAGTFRFDRGHGEGVVHVKAAGYRRSQLPAGDVPQAVRLEPVEVRALYLNQANVGNLRRRAHVLNLIRNSSSNAIVVEFKSADGYLAAPVDHGLARQIGAAGRLPIQDLAATVAGWKAEGIYTIAMIALFKDDLAAVAAPQLALRSQKTTQVIRDQYGVAWTDPAALLVRSYNIKVAEAAAAAGFDEIQFDFVRYPAEPLSFEGAGPEENRRRLAIVSRFLRRVTDVLAPYSIYVGASVFGSVCFVREIGPIGQDLEEFASLVDYVSPMLYPSYFASTENDARPILRPYPLVYGSLRTAAERLGGNSRRLRPWLQNFPDRAPPKAPLDAGTIRAQMQAAQDAQANGWMMWDAGNRYVNTLEALRGLSPAEPPGDRFTAALVTPRKPGEVSQPR